MLNWLRSVFQMAEPKSQPEVGVKAHAVDVGATPDVREERNRQRRMRLVAALAAEGNAEKRAAIKAELARRQHSGR